jgi:hypothetical protein
VAPAEVPPTKNVAPVSPTSETSIAVTSAGADEQPGVSVSEAVSA